MWGNGFGDSVAGEQEGVARRVEFASPDFDYEDGGIGSYFGMGLAAGAGMGAVALLTLHLAGISPAINVDGLAHSVQSSVQSWTWSSEPGTGSTKTSAAQDPIPDVFDMKLVRVAGVSTPFRLRVVGASDAATGVLLHGLPAGAQLSRGERRDDSTWSIPIADLSDLHLTFADNAPQAFDVRIDVMAPRGVEAARSIARVHVVDVPATPMQVAAPAAPPPPAAPAVVAKTDAPTPIVTRTTTTTTIRIPPRAERQVARPAPPPSVQAPAEPAPAPQVAQSEEAEQRHFPEGASALGAISRDTERQVWWKLPALTWSPFLDGASR